MRNYSVDLENVSFSYQIRNVASKSLKDAFINGLRRESKHVEIEALSNVSLQIEPGEVTAIVGKNGAGKSTLLKLVSGVLPPTSGRILVRGQVAPMLQLGAGFHSDMSGYENIILYGMLLGRSRDEMSNKAEAITNWAELNDAIHLPIRTYSSGMIARLAFSIATDLPADVILVDEVLSVGDFDFQKKSKNRMIEQINSGAAVILVTHDLSTARELATSGILLDHGRVIEVGSITRVLDCYLEK
jgi:ABC-2 type transport system ATP-binding protein